MSAPPSRYALRVTSHAAPSDRPGAAVAPGLAALIRDAADRGAFLRVAALPLEAVEVGFGTLEGGAPATDGPGIERHDLTATDGASLGTLWLDGSVAHASQAVRIVELAIDSAWSRAQVAQTESRLRALDDATRAIAGELDLDRVLQLMVDSVRELAQARWAALGILDPNGRIERFITSGMSAQERLRIGAAPRGHGLLGLIIREGISIRIPDISAHPDSYGFPPEHPPMHSFLGVPVRIAGRPIGNFYLTDRAGTDGFTDSEQELVEMFAIHAGIAIQNARLHARVQQLAIVDERVRIGRDLHDGIIQGIYAVALSLEDVPELAREDVEEATARVDRAIDRLNTTIRDIRTFIVGLSVSEPEVTLATTLAGLVDEIHLDPEVEVRLDLADADEVARRLPPEAVHEVVQIAREALSNVARHSGASQVALSLRLEGADAELVVDDDGRGFNPSRRPPPGHFGLANLRDRATAIGGILRVESGPGSGTRIIVRLLSSAAETARP